MTAPKSVDLVFRGLMTDPNPYVVPDGALSTADNVVIERDGLVQPRPGFQNATDAGLTAVSNSPVQAVLPFGSSYFAVLKGASYSLRQEDGTEVTDEASASIDFDASDKIHAAEGGGALFVTCADGVRRLDSTTATTAYRVGVPRMIVPGLALSADAPSWLANSDAAAYRLVLRRAVGDREYRGAPSAIYGIDNGAGGARSVDLTVYLPPDAVAGDVLEVYRTPTITGTWADAGDEMQLAHSVTLASADITAGSVTVEDRTDDTDLGAFLYTNATQQGLIQANFRPPKADAIALYNAMMVYGGTEQPGRVFLQLSGTPAANVSEGPIKDTATIDTTVSSNVITTSLSPSPGWVGMVITDRSAGPGAAGTNIPADTLVTAVDVGLKTVTLSKQALATNTGVSAFLADFVAIDSTNYYAWDSEDAAERLWDASLATREAVASIARVINQDTATHVAYMTASDDAPGAFLIEAAALDQSSYTVSTSREIGWDLTPADGVADKEDRPGRLYVSKPSEFESVPPVNFFDIGDDAKAVLGLARARDALLVFKDDGVFALTGDVPETLRVDSVDSDLVLLSRRCLDTMEDMAFAATNRGVVAVTRTGAANLSARTIQHAITEMQNTKAIPVATHLFCDPNQRRLYLHDSGNNQIFVYHADTSAWTRWTLPGGMTQIIHGAYRPSAKLSVLVGRDSGNEPLVYLEAGPGFSYDRTFDVTITAATDISAFVGAGTWTITISAGSGWTPAVGDAIGDGNNLAIITAVDSATEFTINTEDTFSTGAATAYEAFTAKVAPVVRTAKDPFSDKHWLTATYAFVLVDNLRTVTLNFTSNANTTADSLSETLTSWANSRWAAASEARYTFRALVPSDQGRGAVLLPEVEITQATSRWALAGLAVSYDPMSDRVHA